VSDPVQVQLEIFEGPLDLLLHLVKKHELNILDIPIAFVTEKYLETISLMQTLNLDVAGEYLLMAATLAYIKSRELVPSPDPLPGEAGEDGEEEEGDPRQELIRRLLEYQKYKEAARELGERPVVGRNVWTRKAPAQPEVPAADAPLAAIPVHKLIEAFEGVLKRARIKLSHDVVIDRISITDKINQLVDRLQKEQEIPFEACFGLPAQDTQQSDLAASVDRFEVVITFLAILEMTRLHLLELKQHEDRGTILLCRPSETPAAPTGGILEDYR
jgi:segregation and condensation protein A